MKFKEGLTFDDVLLEPQYSEITSRSQVNISTQLGNLTLEIPILSANMDSVTEETMAHAMHQLGGLGILHRYATADQVFDWMTRLDPKARFPSVGVQKEDIKKAELYFSMTNNICIDIAHGDSNQVVEMIKVVKSIGYQNIMAGNVATGSGARRLVDAGANIIKAGVGGGSVCTTRIVTGHGVPQLTAIHDVYNAVGLNKNATGAHIVADGGVRNSGDIVKCLAFGADAVMLGGLLAGTDESPAAKTGTYRGMASEMAQTSYRGAVSNGAAEGVAVPVTKKGSVARVMGELCGGIRSGLSYSGCLNISLLKQYAEFIKISNNGLIESHPHAIK